MQQNVHYYFVVLIEKYIASSLGRLNIHSVPLTLNAVTCTTTGQSPKGLVVSGQDISPDARGSQHGREIGAEARDGGMQQKF